MGSFNDSLVIILPSNQIDIKLLLDENPAIKSTISSNVKVINVLLNFDIDDPCELDSILNLLYTVLREQVDYTVSINVLFKNKEQSIETQYGNLMKNGAHIFAPNGYKIDSKTPVTFFNPSKFENQVNYVCEASNKGVCGYKPFKISAVGGTFDHLHDGHKILLALSVFLTSKKLIIGLTSEALLVNKKFKEFLETFETRQDQVLKFLNLLDPSLEYDVLPIKDVCGPTGYEPNIEALIVSQETKSGGEFINKTRAEKGLSQLAVYVVDVLGGKEKLSSTQLRKLVSEKSAVEKD